MFNLLVFGVDWSSGRVTVPVGRILEYTDDHVAAQFPDVDKQLLLDRLSALPCLFCEEGTTDQTAYVGQIYRARNSGRDLTLEITLDAEVHLLRNSIIFESRAELEIRDFEFSRNHWAVKDVDLYRFLLRKVRPRRQRPTVFQIAEHENVEPTLASAMMPFDAGFNDVYASIREAAEGAGLLYKRADDSWESPAIIRDVVSLIDRSRVVVCDCTGRNLNVFYEVGIAHTLGRDVILITQSEHDIPFDLRHLRHVRYHNNGEARAALMQSLRNGMQTLMGH